MTASKTAVRVQHFECIDSTSAEALRQLGSGAVEAFWIVAASQSQGRGRNGRRWHSPEGNLYATFGFRPHVSAGQATELSFVAALAAYDAIAAHLPAARHGELTLKWPNDILLNGGKIAGILIESVSGLKGAGLPVAIGIGINAAAPPPDTGREVASLGLGPAGCAAVFRTLASALAAWLETWDSGAGFPTVRQTWVSRAHAAGELLSLSLNGASIQGKFRGVNERGALQLEALDGTVITVNAGEIYPASQTSP